MTRALKLTVAFAILAGCMFTAMRTNAYPPFVRKAEKFGAKDCLFCHKEPNGGEGWNDRGNWLIAEKERRKADSIDMEWLAEYKEGGDKPAADKADKKEGEEKKSDDSSPPMIRIQRTNRQSPKSRAEINRNREGWKDLPAFFIGFNNTDQTLESLCRNYL